MLRFFRKVRGSVSLILILIMLPIMTYATMIVDGTRVMSAKTAVSGAGDLTMNTALSTYDAALKDAYGLFAMCDNLGDLQTTFETYFSNTMAGTLANVAGNDNEIQNFIDNMTGSVTQNIFGVGNVDPEEMVNHLAMDVNALTVKGNSSSTLSNPAVMKRQIVEYMKYKAPIMFASDIMDKLEMFKGAQEQTKAIGAQIDYTKSCDSLQEACENAKNSIYAYNDAVIQLDSITGNKAAGYFDVKLGNAGSTDTVYADLHSATENLLYFKNLYTFWDNSRKVYIADIDKTTNGGVNYAVNTFSYYELAKNSDGTYSNRFTIQTNQKKTDAITDSSSNDVLDILNETVTNQQNTTQKVLVKNSSLNGKHLENTIALKANYEEVLDVVNNRKSAFSNVYRDLNEVLAKSDSVEYITAYYQFLEKHNFQELGELSAIYQQWTGNARSYFQAEEDLLTFLNANINVWAENVTVDSSQKITLENVDESKIAYGDMQRYRLVCAYLKLLQDVCGCELNVTLNGSNVVLDIGRNDAQSTYEGLIRNHYSYDLYQKLSEVINACASKRDAYLNTAKTQFGNANDKINEFVNQLKTVKEKIGTVCTDMDNVLKFAKEVHTSLNTWDTEIKNTPDGGTKDTMQATHDAEENKIVLEEVEALKTFAYNQKKAYEDYYSYIDSITYFGEKAVSNGSLNAETFVANSITGGKWRTESTYNTATQIDLTKSRDVSGMASDCMKKYFQQNSKDVTSTPDNLKNAVQRDNAYFKQFGFVQSALNAPSTNGVSRNGNYIYLTYFSGDANLNAKTFYEKLINITTKLQNNDDSKKDAYKSELTGQSGTNTENEKTNTKKEDVTTPKSDNNRKPGSTDSAAPDAFKTITGKENGSSELEGSSGAGNASNSAGNTAGSIDNIKGDEDKDGKNKATAESQKNTLTSAGSFLDKIAGLANNAISKAYLEEYFTNMFSCYTTDLENGNVNVKEISLEGHLLSNNHHYLYEQEYIIWGGDVSGAVGKTMGVIYGIRFVFNTIYAFTSAEVQQIALNIATAIAGWTVFGIPIVQAIVTIVLSLAESGIDLWKLSEGYDVPIMKSRETWSCSVSGIVNYAANTAIDKGSQLLKELANEEIENASASLNDFVNGQVTSAASALKNSLNAAISSAVLDFYAKTGLDQFKNDLNNNVDAMNGVIQNAVANVENIIDESEAPDAVKNAEKEALNQLGVKKIADTITNEIKGKVNVFDSSNVVSEIQKLISEKIDGLVDSVNGKIKDVINAGTKEIEKAVNDGVDNATKKLKEGAKDKINEAMDKYMKSSKKSSASITETDPKSKGTGLTLNYKQYVKIFTLVGLMTNEDAMLQRCAALIQVNMNQNADLQTTGKSDYNLGTAYTLAEIDATVELNTIFSYEANVNGEMGEDDDGLYSGLRTLWNNPGKSQLHYHSVMGY